MQGLTGNTDQANQVKFPGIIRKLGEKSFSSGVHLKGCDPDPCSSLGFCELPQYFCSEFCFGI